jgi:hypothetical protein
MPTCNQCGEEIEFRYINGRPVPLHLNGGGWTCSGYGGSAVNDYAGYSRSDKSRCYQTKCPECGDGVYFIRHNGGSVWIDPPLGPPWYKHPCMDKTYTSVKGVRRTLAAGRSLPAQTQNGDLIIGIVKEAETSLSKKCSVISIETGAAENIVLLMKENVSFLVGCLVLYHKKEQRVSSWENDSDTFHIIMPVTPSLGADELQRTVIRCPECRCTAPARGMLGHLRARHRFLRTIEVEFDPRQRRRY